MDGLWLLDSHLVRRDEGAFQVHAHDVGSLLLPHGIGDGLDVLHEVLLHGGVEGGVEGGDTVVRQILGHGQHGLGGAVLRSVSLEAVDVGVDEAGCDVGSLHVIDLGGG